MSVTMTRTTFQGHSGDTLAARLDLPAGKVRATALFAHCFTCSKDLVAVRSISRALAEHGIAVLRFDFTGLGSSEGEFANTNFSSNVEDLVLAARHLEATLSAPAILIGHSLGGAAVLAAADQIPQAKAVATIGAPADTGHVLSHLGASLDRIRAEGSGEVTLGGRNFRIEKQFVDDVEDRHLLDHVANLRRALLVLHSPLDDVVGIDNATKIFVAAKHPKSFVSLDHADHMLSDGRDARYAAGVIAAWAERFLPEPKGEDTDREAVIISETGLGKYQNAVAAGPHHLLADEPTDVGGLGSGPSPYDFLSIALGTCTSMTLRMYADHKKLDLGKVTVKVKHGKVPIDHCEDCGEAIEGRAGKIDRFERIISIEGDVDPGLGDKLVEIAGKCPVHRTLESSSAVVTHIRTPKPDESAG